MCVPRFMHQVCPDAHRADTRVFRFPLDSRVKFRIIKSTEKEGRLVAARDWGSGEWKVTA